MPRYTYHCGACKQTYEVKHSINEIHSVCDRCGEKDYLNKIPSFVTITKKVDGKQNVGQVMKDSIEDFRRDLQEQKESLLNREYNNDD